MEHSNARWLPKDSVLIALNGAGKTRGTVAMLRIEATCNQSIVCMSPKDRAALSPEFLFHFLDGQYRAIRDITGDKDRRGLNMPLVRSIEIPVPPLAEQQRIVTLLDDALAELTIVAANAEKNLSNAQKLFESHLNSAFKVDRGWEETTLGAIAEFKNGLNFTKGSKGEKIRIVGVKDFQKNFWLPSEDLDCVQIEGKLNEAYTLRKHDILTVRSNGNKQLIGRCILATDVLEKTSHSGFTIRIRITRADVNPEYLVRYLKSGESRNALIESGDGAQINNLNQQALSTLPVKLLDGNEQQALVRNLEEVEVEAGRLAESYRQKIDHVSELKRSIVQKAFSGELTSPPSLAIKEAAE